MSQAQAFAISIDWNGATGASAASTEARVAIMAKRAARLKHRTANMRAGRRALASQTAA
jgi:hypothetical protein